MKICGETQLFWAFVKLISLRFVTYFTVSAAGKVYVYQVLKLKTP